MTDFAPRRIVHNQPRGRAGCTGPCIVSRRPIWGTLVGGLLGDAPVRDTLTVGAGVMPAASRACAPARGALADAPP